MIARRPKIALAIVLLAAAIVINVVILASGDVSPGWPLAAVILLGAAGTSLLVERRGWGK
jgi:hypothetical protein